MADRSIARRAALAAALILAGALAPLGAGAQGMPDVSSEDDAANMDELDIPIEPEMTEPDLSPSALPESLLLPLGQEGETLDGGSDTAPAEEDADEPPAN